GGDRRQAPGRCRRLHRQRQYPARHRPHAARGGCAGGARADLVAAGAVALLLRHRLRLARRVDRARAQRRRHPNLDRGGFARLRLARRAHRGDGDRQGPPVPRVLRRGVPRGSGRPGSSLEARTRGDRLSSYADAGVDVEAGERAVELMRERVAATMRPEVVGDLGGFAGLFDASALARYKRPLLATATDGVGTKIAVARAMDIHDTIGIDLVAMVVDDLVVCGAEPLFMTDYIATGKVVPERIAAIVSGIATGCEQAGCALLGGETAEHPGLMADDEYDVAGAGTAVVEADRLLGPDRMRAGDTVIAMASSGLHSNGYSLARKVLLADATLDTEVAEFGRTLGEEMLEPTRIYTQDCLALADAGLVHAFAHVTGGGLASNLARVLPE